MLRRTKLAKKDTQGLMKNGPSEIQDEAKTFQAFFLKEHPY